MIVAIGTRLIYTLMYIMTLDAIALLQYLKMGTTRVIVSTMHMAIIA